MTTRRALALLCAVLPMLALGKAVRADQEAPSALAAAVVKSAIVQQFAAKGVELFPESIEVVQPGPPHGTSLGARRVGVAWLVKLPDTADGLVVVSGKSMVLLSMTEAGEIGARPTATVQSLSTSYTSLAAERVFERAHHAEAEAVGARHMQLKTLPDKGKLVPHDKPVQGPVVPPGKGKALGNHVAGKGAFRR